MYFFLNSYVRIRFGNGFKTVPDIDVSTTKVPTIISSLFSLISVFSVAFAYFECVAVASFQSYIRYWYLIVPSMILLINYSISYINPVALKLSFSY